VAETEYDFGSEMRGYRRDAVDRALQELRRELIAANTGRADSVKELTRLHAVVDDLQAELDEVGRPTYTGLGSKLEQTLRLAEEQSMRLISEADLEAEKVRTSAQRASQQLHAEATQRSEQLLTDATARANQLIDTAASEAENTLARARVEADSLVTEATRDAAATRGAAATEGAEAR
jgi:cell division septum initiation protein DivIVA